MSFALFNNLVEPPKVVINIEMALDWISPRRCMSMRVHCCVYAVAVHTGCAHALPSRVTGTQRGQVLRSGLSACWELYARHGAAKRKLLVLRWLLPAKDGKNVTRSLMGHRCSRTGQYVGSNSVKRWVKALLCYYKKCQKRWFIVKLWSDKLNYGGLPQSE